MNAARKFYKRATAFADEHGYGVKLDERELKTPAGKKFRAPTRALAAAVAAEWDAQGEMITPSTMPLSQLAFVSIDQTPERADEIAKMVAKYAGTDLLCHRAATPAALVERQSVTWDPLVAWAAQRFHFRPNVVTGVIAAPMPPQDSTVMEREADDLDDFRRTALAQAVSLTGSAYLGFALVEGAVSADAAFATAALDNLWSLENWGEDAEARAKLERLKSDLEAVARFIAALSD